MLRISEKKKHSYHILSQLNDHKWSEFNVFYGDRRANLNFILNKITLNESPRAWPTYKELYETETGQQAQKGSWQGNTDRSDAEISCYIFGECGYFSR